MQVIELEEQDLTVLQDILFALLSSLRPAFANIVPDAVYLSSRFEVTEAENMSLHVISDALLSSYTKE